MATDIRDEFSPLEHRAGSAGLRLRLSIQSNHSLGGFLLAAWWIPVGIAFFSGALIGNSRRRLVEQRVGGSILSPRVETFVGLAGIILTGIFQIAAALVGNLGTGS